MPSLPSPPSWIAAKSSVDHLTNASVAMVHSQVSPSLQRVVGLIVPLLVSKTISHIVESFHSPASDLERCLFRVKGSIQQIWPPSDDLVPNPLSSGVRASSSCGRGSSCMQSSSCVVPSGASGVQRWEFSSMIVTLERGHY